MPFYAKDWRSPGESWIKTEDGWEKLKVLETNRKRLISEDGVFYRLVIFQIIYHSPILLFVYFLLLWRSFAPLERILPVQWHQGQWRSFPGRDAIITIFLSYFEKQSQNVNYVLFSLFQGRRFLLFLFFLHGKNNRMWGRSTPCFPLRSLSWIVFIYFYQLLHWRVRDELKTVRSLKILWMLANLITTLSFSF